MGGCPVFFRATGAFPNAPRIRRKQQGFPTARVKAQRLRLRPGDRVEFEPDGKGWPRRVVCFG